MTEVVGFCQEDLDEDDVMLLDTWEEVRKSLLPFSSDMFSNRFMALVGGY